MRIKNENGLNIKKNDPPLPVVKVKVDLPIPKLVPVKRKKQPPKKL
jgi:hypothetical protein